MSTRLVKHPKTRGFTQIENGTLRRPDLSFKAKGVLALVLGLKEGSATDAKSLAVYATDGRDAIRSAKRELRELGHLVTIRSQDDAGRWTTVEHYFEVPVDIEPKPGCPASADPASETSALTTEDRLLEDPCNTSTSSGPSPIVAQPVDNFSDLDGLL